MFGSGQLQAAAVVQGRLLTEYAVLTSRLDKRNVNSLLAVRYDEKALNEPQSRLQRLRAAKT